MSPAPCLCLLGSRRRITSHSSTVTLALPSAAGRSRLRCRMPMKVSEVIKLLELDGWSLKRTTGSHRHYTHPAKPGLVTVAGKPSATLKPGTEASILKQAGLRRECP